MRLRGDCRLQTFCIRQLNTTQRRLQIAGRVSDYFIRRREDCRLPIVSVSDYTAWRRQTACLVRLQLLYMTSKRLQTVGCVSDC
jgi:hypothetical protein